MESSNVCSGSAWAITVSSSRKRRTRSLFTESGTAGKLTAEASTGQRRRTFIDTERLFTGRFGDLQGLIGGGGAEDLVDSAGPTDFDFVNMSGFPQAEVEGEGVLGVVAAPAHDFVDLFATSGGEDDAGSDGAAV